MELCLYLLFVIPQTKWCAIKPGFMLSLSYKLPFKIGSWTLDVFKLQQLNCFMAFSTQWVLSKQHCRRIFFQLKICHSVKFMSAWCMMPFVKSNYASRGNVRAARKKTSWRSLFFIECYQKQLFTKERWREDIICALLMKLFNHCITCKCVMSNIGH